MNETEEVKPMCQILKYTYCTCMNHRSICYLSPYKMTKYEITFSALVHSPIIPFQTELRRSVYNTNLPTDIRPKITWHFYVLYSKCQYKVCNFWGFKHFEVIKYIWFLDTRPPVCPIHSDQFIHLNYPVCTMEFIHSLHHWV